MSSGGVPCNDACPFPAFNVKEKFSGDRAAVDLLQGMDIFAQSGLCIDWSWKEFKNGVLCPSLRGRSA